MKKYALLALWAAVTLLLCGLVHARDEGSFQPHALHRPTHLMEDVGSSVVKLSRPGSRDGHGTGFVVQWAGRTFTVTNRHVCALRRANIVEAQRQDGSVAHVRVLRLSSHTDLCLLEPVPGLKPLRLATQWRMGEAVRALGHPRGGRLTETEGLVLGAEMVLQDYPSEQCPAEPCRLNFITQATSVPVWPGNSGSPLVNALGEVVGVVWATNLYLRISFSVPLEDLREEISSLAAEPGAGT